LECGWSLVVSDDSTLFLLPTLRAVRGATPYMRNPIDRLWPCEPLATSVRSCDRRGLRHFHRTPGTSLRFIAVRELNPRHSVADTNALPTELTCDLLRCAFPVATWAFDPNHTTHRLSFPLRGTQPAFATSVLLAKPANRSTWTSALRREASNT
jgi:hypothetical protein